MNRITNVSELDAAVKQAEEMLHADSHRILVCAGTGCLAGGSQKIYDRFCEMAKQSEGVKVEFVPEAEDTVIKESCHVGVKRSISTTATATMSRMMSRLGGTSDA